MVKIPTRLEDLLPAAAMEKVMEVLHQPDLSSSLRDALHKVGLKDANPLAQVQDAWKQARGWLESLTQRSGSGAELSTTINATGQLITPGLQNIPMGSSVAFAFAKAAAAYQNAESLRAKAKQTAADAFERPAVWIDSSFAALQLLHSSSETIVISRADSVRVPAFGDVRAMLAAFGKQIVEVGAANGGTENDWRSALTSAKQSLLLVSPNNLTSEIAAEQRAMAIAAAKHVGATIIDLLIDGTLSQALGAQYGFPDVKQSFSAGIDLVLLPLHILVGAPAGVAIIGNEKRIQALSAIAQSLGISSLGPQLAASCVAIDGLNAGDSNDVSLLNRLLTNTENLKDRCRRLAIQLNDTRLILAAVEVERSCSLGPTPWDRYQMKNWAVRVSLRDNTAAAADRMRCQLLQPSNRDRLPIACCREGSDLLLDLRFVGPEDDHEIVVACLGESEGPRHQGGGGEEATPC